MPKPYPTQARLKELFDYDPETGILKWKIKSSPKINIGDAVGSYDKKGYLVTSLNRVCYKVHRLIWILNYGCFQTNLSIDHINRIKNDNRLCNLRLVSNQENHFNRSLNLNNTSGYIGVDFLKKPNKYRASIRFFGKKIHLGLFKTAEEASDAYQKAKIKYHFIGGEK